VDNASDRSGSISACDSVIPLLDHGYLTYVDHWGSDSSIVKAARMSTGKGFLGWGPMDCPSCKSSTPICPIVACDKCGGTGKVAGDEKLLAYLWSQKHTTPFEMAGLTVEVFAPIVVFREWHRHRTQSYNEMSARYAPLPDVNYVPQLERVLRLDNYAPQSKTAQGGAMAGADPLTVSNAQSFLDGLDLVYFICEALYQAALTDGVPKELARLCLPVGRYSKMRASANLWNWLRFLKLRMAPEAMWEIRQYANAISRIIKELFPRTYALFDAEMRDDK
jgi:thymidylate synthase (FAD)